MRVVAAAHADMSIKALKWTDSRTARGRGNFSVHTQTHTNTHMDT